MEVNDLKDTKCVQVLTAHALGKEYDKETFGEIVAHMAELAKDPSPNNLYELAQILAITVQEVSVTSEDWLTKVAEVKNINVGDKAQFKVDKNYIKAYIQAKGSTTQRSRCVSNYVSIETDEVSARPYIDMYDVRSGRFDFADWILKASDAMNTAKLVKINTVLKNGFNAGALSGNYVSGNGVIKGTLDPLLQKLSRLGKTRLVGDIAVISKLNDISGFQGVNIPSEMIQNEIYNTGYVGRYLGSEVAKFNNPCYPNTLKPILDTNKIYTLTGYESPLKVVNEGGIYSSEYKSIDSDTLEVCLRQYFGAGIVVGTVPTTGCYEDTSM